MRFLLKKLFGFLLPLLLIFLFFTGIAFAISIEDCEEKVKDLPLAQLKECEGKFEGLFKEATTQKKTLDSEIRRFNASIAIANAKIFTAIKEIQILEKEITSLGGKISVLDLSLDQLSELLIERISETYKRGRINLISLFLSSESFSNFVSRYKYLQVIQLHDRELMVKMETARSNFEDQKNLKEEKQEELEVAKKNLEVQKNALDRYRKDKERLLEITQSNEIRYQNLLRTTRQEIEAIQGIIAGKGDEVEVGKVEQGSVIASIISGASACSTGSHLHFQIAEAEETKNPFNFLKNVGLDDDSGGDPHQGLGDWEWPLDQSIKFNQGYGSNTSAIRSGAVWYDFHTGIDISSGNLVVKSVKQGNLYRGSIPCGGGNLRYVRVDHDDSNIDTYYLHINY